MTQFLIKKESELNAENSFFMLKGFVGTAVAGQVTALDWELPGERWLTGGKLTCSGHEIMDQVDLFIVMKDGNGNDLYAAQFVDKATVGGGIDEHVPYTTLVPSGWYLRVKYYSTGSTDVQVGLNMRLHRPKDVSP
jgi:hypothetical protein